jgi:anti-sigma factor RsiW
MEMPDMEMPDVSGTDAHASDNLPGWVDAGNWVWTVLFVVAAVVLGYGLVSQRSASRRRRARSWRSTVSTAVQVLMAAGMAIMFGTLLLQD